MAKRKKVPHYKGPFWDARRKHTAAKRRVALAYARLGKLSVSYLKAWLHCYGADGVNTKEIAAAIEKLEAAERLENDAFRAMMEKVNV